MKELTCDECGRAIEGYTEKHVNTLLAQHKIRHQNERGKKND